jgi:hypothetical protein
MLKLALLMELLDRWVVGHVAGHPLPFLEQGPLRPMALRYVRHKWPAKQGASREVIWGGGVSWTRRDAAILLESADG